IDTIRCKVTVTHDRTPVGGRGTSGATAFRRVTIVECGIAVRSPAAGLRVWRAEVVSHFMCEHFHRPRKSGYRAKVVADIAVRKSAVAHAKYVEPGQTAVVVTDS